MSAREEAPDVDRLARSMLMLYGAHDDHDEHEASRSAALGVFPNHRISRLTPTAPLPCGRPHNVTASAT
jgi:hypothetical protein